MPDAPIDRCEHYVYALLREDGQTPFYIGVGNRYRINRHSYEFTGRNPKKEKIVKDILATGIKLPSQKIMTGLTRAEAAQIERDMILLIGREPNGPLTNLTAGGGGAANPSDSTKEKWREALRKRWRDDPESTTRGILLAVEAARSPEARAKRAESIRQWHEKNPKRPPYKLKLSEEARQKRRDVMRQNKAAMDALAHTPNAVQKRVKKMKETLATIEGKAIWSEASKKKWAEKRDEINRKRAATRLRNGTASKKKMTQPSFL
jgi:hypothetical protein